MNAGILEKGHVVKGTSLARKITSSESLLPRRVRCQSCKELPGGAYWLPSSATKYDVVYGQDFVLQRCKRNGPGLTIASKDTKLSLQEEPSCTSLATRNKTRSGPPTRQPGSLWDITDITDYTFLGDTGLIPGTTGPFLLPSAASSLHQAGAECTGIILHPAAARNETQDLEAEEDLHPRRTKKVKFTCKLCETTNVKRVSPHGWNSGTVFARCEGCQVVHKLVDNLNICHELKGAVFPRPNLKGLKIPPGLPQKPQLDYHRHPSLYQEFLEDQPDC